MGTGATSGKISIDVEADVRQFAAQLQKDLDKAIRSLKVNMEPLSKQLSEGVEKGFEAAEKAAKEFAEQADKSLKQVAEQARTSGAAISTAMAGGVDDAAKSLPKVTEQAKRSAKQIGDSFMSAGRKMSTAGDQMTMAVTLPLIGAGVTMVHAAANFEKAMNQVRAVSGAAGDDFVRLRQQAVDLGSSTKFSASQAADAMGFLAMAGFKVNDIYGAMPDVLNLASAGAVDLARAADITSNILSGYGLHVSQLAHVNDVLAKTFTSTNTNLSMLGDTFKYAAPVASSAGLQFEEVAAAIGLMGNAGIQGEMAGTSLRGAITRLLAPTKMVRKALKDLNVSVVDSSGQLLPLATILDKLQKAGATTADMMHIFGLEAGPGMQALLAQGAPALADLTAQLVNAGGTADRIAKTQMEGFAGSWDELRSAAEGFAIAIGDSGVLGDLTRLVERTTSWVAHMSKANPALLRAAFYAGVFAAALGPVIAITGRLVTSIGAIIKAVSALRTVLAGGSLMAALTNPVTIAIVAVAALAAGLYFAYTHSKRFREIVDQAFRAVAAAAQWLWSTVLQPVFTRFMAITRQVAGVVRQVWQSTWLPALRQAGAQAKTMWEGSLRPALAGLWQALQRAGAAIRQWWDGTGRPAFQQAATIIGWWWNNVTLPALKGLMTVLGVVAGIVLWFATNVVLPTFTAIVTAVTWVINAAVWLHGVAQTVFHAVGAVLSWLWGVAQQVFAGIASVVKIGLAPALWFIDTFGPLFMALGQLVWTVFSGVFQIVFALLKTAFDVIVQTAQRWWSVMSMVWTAVAGVIAAVWAATILPVIQAIGALFAWLWDNAIKPKLDALAAGFSFLWEVAKAVWAQIVGAVKTAVAAIVATAVGIANYIAQIVGFWTNLVNSVRERIGSMASLAASIPGRIASAIGNLGSLLYNAGRNVIQGLINGIGSMISALKDKISRAASAIRDALPFSPAKYGPLSGGGSPDIAGAAVVDMVAAGMQRQMPKLRAAAWSVADAAAAMYTARPHPGGGGIREAAGVAVSGASVVAGSLPAQTVARTLVINYAITVNSLDPRNAGTIIVEAIKDFEKSNGAGWRR